MPKRISGAGRNGHIHRFVEPIIVPKHCVFSVPDYVIASFYLKVYKYNVCMELITMYYDGSRITKAYVGAREHKNRLCNKDRDGTAN